MALPSPNTRVLSKGFEKQPSMRRKTAEKSVLDDIMGDSDDFGDTVDSDAEIDGGRWEDTLREMGQDDIQIEKDLQQKILNLQASFHKPISKEDRKLSDAVQIDMGHEHMQVGKESESNPKAETFTGTEGASYVPASVTSNVSTQHAILSTRYFIIKSLNYHNIEKSVQRGIWATQAMNERILNEAYETAERVLLIFSVNMSGHFQGYAEMVSPIGRQKVNVWSEANWGGTFSVEWIRLYDLPFQKTLHLKNPLNSFKPVKISRDCQELTGEIGEALCALIDEGAESEENYKRKINARGEYFTKKPYTERLPYDSTGFFRPLPLRAPMSPMMYPTSFQHPLSPELSAPIRSSPIKYPGSSSSRSVMSCPDAMDVNHFEKREGELLSRNAAEAAREEDLLNMSYEEYLQCRGNPREDRFRQQGAGGIASAQAVAQYGTVWNGNGITNAHSDDPYAKYLATWYANQQSALMQNKGYFAGPTMANIFQSNSSSEPP